MFIKRATRGSLQIPSPARRRQTARRRRTRYVPLSQTGADILLEIFSQRHERSSTIVTSNLPFEEWTSVFGNQRLNGALLDRLTHHVHILELNGESYRLKQSKAARRCATQPLTKPQSQIPKPAKSSAPHENRSRPGYETPAISAGADAARLARCPRLRSAGRFLVRR